MESKIFSKNKNKNKIKIKIRKLSEGDLKKAKGFQDFTNSLVEEGAKILGNKKVSLEEEREWLIDQLKKIKNKKTVLLAAEVNKELKPKPKIIRLGAFPTNKIAISLYKKFGFREVAKIPEELEHKGKLFDEIIMHRYL